jgi:hypothetical protein
MISGVTSISAPANSFTSTYANYRILLSITSVVSDSGVECRLRASGSDDSVATYNHGVFSMASNNVSGGYAANESLNRWILSLTDSANNSLSLSMDLFRPKETERTSMSFLSQGASNTTVFNSYYGAGVKAATTSFDSISFLAGSNISGRLSVYGYNI